MSSHIPLQLEEIKDKIAEAARTCGRDPEEVKLLAVSKTFPVEDVKAAYDAGQRIFGENRVQELEEKTGKLPDDIKWHLIGHLQSNKVRKAVENSALIHSVDSLKLARKIDKVAGECGKKQKILLEINVSGEDSKFGVAVQDEAVKLAEEVAGLENIELLGLMTMAPFGADEDELKEIFASLRHLRERIEEQLKIQLPELSMGMSSDYQAAIEEGATMVRIGTAIFGKRTYA